MSHIERVIVLVDMDCFYCQVEEKLNPVIKGKPIAVVQYNTWRGGGIIAVNYLARNQGVTRHMRGDEAQKKCPEIVLCRVPNIRGKADLTKYRAAGKEVANVLQNFTSLMLRASIDEAYLDITELVNKKKSTLFHKMKSSDLPHTHVVGCDIDNFIYNTYKSDEIDEADLKLIIGALIVEELRLIVYEKTGYTCSAGIAHNKILAKLACGLNKPNKQTILPHKNVKILYDTLPVKKIKNLGGKFGVSLTEDLNITYMNELEKFTEKQLQQKYDEKTGTWLYNIARGIDLEPVIPRLCPKSIGCCKRFPGKASLHTFEDVHHWFKELSNEAIERLSQDIIEYHRKAKQIIVSYSLYMDHKDVTSSRSRTLSSYDADKIAEDALEVVKKANPLNGIKFKYAVTYLGLSMGKFEDCKNVVNIKNFFINSAEKYKNENKVFITNQTNDISNNRIENKHTDQEKNAFTYKNEINFNQSNSDSNSKINDICINECSEYENKNLQYVPTSDNTKSFIIRYLLNKNNQTEKSNDNSHAYKNLNEGINSHKESSSKLPENVLNNLCEKNADMYEICSDCSKCIQIFETESHRDYHIALKIAEQQKIEAQNNTQINTMKEVKYRENSLKRNEINKTSQKPNFIYPSIKSYLQNSDELRSVSSRNEFEKCSLCNKEILIEKFIEHLDYHEAKKLHAEINYNNVEVHKKVKEVRSKKRKNTISERVNGKKFRNIDTFFKPL